MASSFNMYYSLNDVAKILNDNQKFDYDLPGHDLDELAAFEKYRQSQSA
ncbi:MAG: hypothetical protein FWC16_01290 [Defluviitaleaceae bacterium]|nr:hypothetical protein [Defluviitaleaceae bacterium]MCL2273538.1 hypothetical protein [Defluviitaleaceae bacterium]